MPTAAPENRPRRILLVATELGPGGAERCLVNLATGLPSDRFEVRVVSLAPRPESNRDALVQRLASAGIDVAFLDLNRWIQWRRGQRDLIELIDGFRPALIQSFLFHANVISAWAAHKAKHESTHVAGLRVADPRRWRMLLERSALRRSPSSIAVSRSVADYYVARGFDRERLEVIPNGIDLQRFDAAADRPITPADAGAAVLFLGRLHPQKGADRLPAIADRFLEANPESMFWVAGDGPLRSKLEFWASTHPHRSRIAIWGWVSDPESLVRRSSLVILPSRWEGMPNALLEAMTAARPVVTAPVEGVAEILGASDDVQICRADDVHLFADRLAQIAIDKQLASSLGERNRRRIETEFSLSKMMDAYQSVYQRLLHRPD